ncbi:MAG: nuclear transport factor 2 family protein [Cyanobacteria bacterium J06649_5]
MTHRPMNALRMTLGMKGISMKGRGNRQRVTKLVAGCAIGWALSLGFGVREGVAALPETAPAELVNAIESIETAASAGDITGVMQNYSPSFTNEDGFTFETLPTALQTLWDQYDSLTYRVELQSWEQANNGYTAETVTYIDGTQTVDGQAMTLESVIRSEQTFVAGKVVSQETLSERNQVTSGDMPPTVSVILPEQVTPGESYDFDAIVMEPLGNRYLLGAAIEEGVTATDFFAGRPIELELLAAGGLFKIGEAPEAPDSRWVSALLVREDGLTVVTRRLRVD